jgi:hypothetical protein
MSDPIAKYYFRNVNKNFILKGFRKLFFSKQPLWLRPNNKMDISLFEELLDLSIVKKLPNIVMMFHSSELMPGGSENFSDREAIDKLYILLEDFFNLLKDRSISSHTLTEAAMKITL